MDHRGKAGCQPIGGLIARIAGTHRTGDMTTAGSASKPTHSGTTTRQPAPAAPTGMRLGEPGSVAPRNSLPAMRGEPMALSDATSRNPAVLLPQCVRSCLAETWIDGDVGSGWNGVVGGYELTQPLAAEERDAAISAAESMLQPAGEGLIVAELGRLRMVTVSRDVGQDLALMFAAYTDELSRYPADAIRDVLRAWPRTQRFWPSIAELVERLERIVRPRRALLDGLRRGYREPETSPDWLAPSEDDKEAVVELLQRHGFSIDPDGRPRPPEREPLTAEQRRQITEQTKAFRLLPEDDPRVQARLREMGAASTSP